MKQINWLSLLLSMTFLCCITLLNAQDAKIPQGIVKGASVEGITEYTLKNGMRVLLFPDQSKATITVNITYLVGSRHEGYGETGMAHLLEHLVFKGTPDHPDIPQELTEHGARPNGTTWYDRTNYFETFSATEKNLRWALDLESDRMINSFIAKKDLDSEMTVVRNEFESGENSPSSILMERVLSTAYLWHNYGKSTIGARSDLENVPIDRLKAFYKKYYQPNNAVLVVAGKIDEAKTIGLVSEYFSDIPRAKHELIPTYTKEPTQDGERLVTLRRTGDVQVVSCMYHTPPGAHPDYAATAVISELLTNEPSGRLYKSLVETKKASYQWGFAPALKEGGFIYMNVDVRKENSLDEAKEIMLSTLDGLADNPPTPEEVDRAKKRILKNLELAFNNSDRIGMRMSEYIAQGDWRLFFLFRDAVEAITVEDVINAANTYFKPSNRTVGLFLPTEKPSRSEIPDAPNIEDLVKNYKGKKAIAEGEAFDPSPANIESRTTRGAGKNGIEFAMLPKETRGDAVVATIKLRYGSEASLNGKGTIAKLTGSMLNRGTTTRTRQEIQDEFDRLKAQVRISAGSAQINTTNENLPAVIELVADILKNPSFDAEEYSKLIEEELSFMEENLSDPSSVADNAFSRALSPYKKGSYHYVMTLEEEIAATKAAKLEEVKAFHKEFYGATDALVSVVGDFEEAAVKAIVLKEFDKWKSPSKYKRVAKPYVANKVENINVETPDKANAMFFAGMNIKMKDDHPDYAAMVIGNYMLGGGFLNSRLATRIRRTDGLSYGVGSWFGAGPYDESATFGSYAIYAPENAAKLEIAFREEIERVEKEGFSKEEVDAAVSGWIQSRQVSRSQDRSLAGRLNRYLPMDRTLEWDAAFEKQIEALTPEKINKTMAKYIDLDKMVFVKAGDFAGAAKKIQKQP